MPVRSGVRTMNISGTNVPSLLQELIEQQAGYIRQTQLPSGAIPWYPGGTTDPWDHVECAIALDQAGCHQEAAGAYRWLRDVQNPDGSWWFRYINNQPQDLTRDANYSSYLAVGLWYHYQVTRDVDFLRQMWPAVEDGVAFALGLQQPSGEIYWARDANGKADPGALLAGSCCIQQSIKCGARIARLLGRDRPDWDHAEARLSQAIIHHPELFDDFADKKHNYAMSWYYPVLTGLVNGKEATERIGQRWDDFIIDGWGCKCQVEQPWWVTTAETGELIMALSRIGEYRRAGLLMEWISRLRDSDGCFWTGMKLPEEEVWPVGEKPTWVAAAVIMAITAQYDGDDATRDVYL